MEWIFNLERIKKSWSRWTLKDSWALRLCHKYFIVDLIQDIVLKDKHSMILEPSNSISKATFGEYVKNLKEKVGVSMNAQHLMFVMGKSEKADEIEPINEG